VARLGLPVLLLAFLPSFAGACESCRDALATDPNALGFSKGIYASIVVMLAVVFTLVAVFVRFVVREARRDAAAGQDGPGR
jgi:heme/copper-type cytochrome/quinol oxidase subunit 2